MAFRVYDASAFYAGIPFASAQPGYTTTLVFEEIKHIKQSHGALDVLLDTGRLQIRDPDSENISFVTNYSKKTGDFQKLSNADISAVALAIQINGELVSDDFAISNLAKNLGILVIPSMTKGIKIVGKWRYFCPACKKEFSSVQNCPNCATKLKRRLFKSP